jgi:hypothetical protein
MNKWIVTVVYAWWKNRECPYSQSREQLLFEQPLKPSHKEVYHRLLNSDMGGKGYTPSFDIISNERI